MTNISITGHDQDSGEMSSTTYNVVIDGTTYKVERWVTRNASGEEWFTEDGESAESPLDDEGDDRLNELMVAFDTAFHERWIAHVQPVIDRITAETVAVANSLTPVD